MNRLEEFTKNGKNFICYDLSGLKTDDEFKDLIATAKVLIKKYPPDSVYTITNMTGAVMTTNTHDIIADWIGHNKPYVKYAAVYGVDFTMKTIGKSVGIVTQRVNLEYVSSREEAMEFLLNLE